MPKTEPKIWEFSKNYKRFSYWPIGFIIANFEILEFGKSHYHWLNYKKKHFFLLIQRLNCNTQFRNVFQII